LGRHEDLEGREAGDPKLLAELGVDGGVDLHKRKGWERWKMGVRREGGKEG